MSCLTTGGGDAAVMGGAIEAGTAEALPGWAGGPHIGNMLCLGNSYGDEAYNQLFLFLKL